MTVDRAPVPRRHHSRRARRRPQAWPLTPAPDHNVRAVLIALAAGAGAALIVFGLLLAVAG